ncbi:hypothetical protein SAMN05192562_1011261 [Kosakonia arachidis]|uniref:Uncharacterized protein n=1 Tax=Kosakonia arachidis TaxID=551989 RepID=A0A1I6ZMY5_9ENTR|nr:hypothetical protein SAMN05192562_1011261 [Kosakonia arachidis]
MNNLIIIIHKRIDYHLFHNGIRRRTADITRNDFAIRVRLFSYLRSLKRCGICFRSCQRATVQAHYTVITRFGLNIWPVRYKQKPKIRATES